MIRQFFRFVPALFATTGLFSMTPDTASAGTKVHVSIPKPRVVIVKPKPKPPIHVAIRPAAPAPHYRWIEGHHDYRSGRWVWVPGHWVAPTPPPHTHTVVAAPVHRPVVQVRPAPPPPSRSVTVSHNGPHHDHRVTFRR